MQTLPGLGTLPVSGHPPPGDAYSLSSHQDEVQALPGGWAQSRSLGTFPLLMPVVSAPSEIRCGHSLVDGHTPRSFGTVPVAGHPGPCGACSLRSLRIEVPTVPRRVAGWRGDWSCFCREFSKVPKRVFLSLRKILVLNPGAPSIQGRACPLTQPISPARPGVVQVRIS